MTRYTIDEALERFGAAAVFKAVWRAFPDEDTKADAITSIFRLGAMQVEIAKDFGVSSSRIGKLVRHGLARLPYDQRQEITLRLHDHRRPSAERFWDFVFPEPNTGCWLFAGGDNGRGYGLFALTRGKKSYAHRIAYESMVGPIPKGLQIDHKCNVRCCVNPDHLEPVTAAENMRRAVARGAVFRAPLTHCRNGHLLGAANTTMRTKRGRTYQSCRTCARAHYKAYRGRKREALS